MKGNKPITKRNPARDHFKKGLRNVTFRAKGRMWFPGAKETGTGDLGFNRYSVSVWKHG